MKRETKFKMASVEVRAVIKFILKDGKSVAMIKNCLDELYRDSSRLSTIYRWIRQFRFGRTSIENLPTDSREVSVRTAKIVEKVHKIDHLRLSIESSKRILDYIKSAQDGCLNF